MTTTDFVPPASPCTTDPPLTALHSLLLAHLANLLHPPWLALGASRGCETPGLRAFMRAAALGTEMAVWGSACWAWVEWAAPGRGRGSRREKVRFFVPARNQERVQQPG
jgi:hypothetical protein